MKLTQPLKWHGGKHYLACRIVSLFPSHLHYVEPYAGGLSVLLAKEPEGVSEVVNDLDGELTNFWRVLQHPEQFPEFLRCVEATPLSEAEWVRSLDGLGEYTSAVGRAWAFFVQCRQSLAGRRTDFAPLSRTRTRRGMNEQASAWLTAIEGLPAVHARLKRVVVLRREALDVIRQQDGTETLFYLDPPYLHATRASTGEYTHEMNEAQHRALLELLTGIQGKFFLSGYANPLYDEAAMAGNWTRHDFELPNNSAAGAVKRRMVECVWSNCARAQ